MKYIPRAAAEANNDDGVDGDDDDEMNGDDDDSEVVTVSDVDDILDVDEDGRKQRSLM